MASLDAVPQASLVTSGNDFLFKDQQSEYSCQSGLIYKFIWDTLHPQIPAKTHQYNNKASCVFLTCTVLWAY